MVSMTITTEDDNTAKLIEPCAPPPSERLKCVQTLANRGIPTVVRIDPIIPHVNDNPEGLIKTLAKTGVKHVTASTYKIKQDNWKRFSVALPETAEKLKPLYFKKGEKMGGYIYLPSNLRLELMINVGELAKKYGMKFGTCRESLSCLNTATCDGSWLIDSTR
jgi:DNA repair photolyase